MNESGSHHFGDAIWFHLRNAVRASSIFGGRFDYGRFIILGRGRTGSNFLRGLLNSHSRIVTFGELFRFYGSIGWEFPFYDRFLQSSRLVSLMQRDPVHFLEKVVFRRFPKKIVAVGFKLFYYHAQEDSRRVLWNYLRDRQDVKIIHLKRNNTLRMILSEKKAFKTDIWTNTTGKPEEAFSVALDYEECLHRFKHEREVTEEFGRYFQEHPQLHVAYERLSADWETEMKSVLEFLGAGYEVLKPATHKQLKQPLDEVILNYAGLKRKFQGTPWEEFFEDT